MTAPVKTLGLLFLAAALGAASRLAAQVATPVSVSGFDDLMLSFRHERDEMAAQRIANYALTERLSTAKLKQWQSALPGDLSRGALTVIADRSTFQPSPASELLSTPAPEMRLHRNRYSRACATT